ncbi:MAG: hypothetical protein LAN64_03780 [Acidobacteriia bacterium]|nr:hypothetical protein [Terriglobia bacterium]
MNRARRRLAVMSVMALALPVLSLAQALPVEQSFSYALDVVNQALDRLGPAEGRLPTLDGFVSADSAQLSRYSQPYYQLQSEVRPDANGGTAVRVSARISALYSNPDNHRSEYRTLVSNGRLEADVLARLARELQEQSSQPKLDRKALESSLADLRSQRAAAEERRTALAKQIHELESLAGTSPLPRLVAVDRAGAAVLASPAPGASTLFRAQSHDEFEVTEERDGWVHVQLGGDSSGWIRRSQVHETETASGFTVARRAFQVVRENVTTFTGNWAELKGKPTLFLWVRPEANTAQDHWSYAQQMFEERAETAGPVEGIVVVFLGDPGVAAATVRDIRRWASGTLSDANFRARCSLDPPRAFTSAKNSATRLARADQRSVNRRPLP